MSEALKVGDRVLATWIDECGDKQTVSGTVANLSASGTMAQIDYLEKSWVLLPLSNLQRIPPSQAEPVAVKLCSWCGRTPEQRKVSVCTECPLPEQANASEPVEAKEPWKPVVGQKVLVEAVVSHDNWHRDTVLVDVGTSINVKVNLSQLRPLPVVQGGD